MRCWLSAMPNFRKSALEKWMKFLEAKGGRYYL